MRRLFTFGCSFTQYWRWPTWADMVGREFDQFENWGICGTGNPAIQYNLLECNQRHSLGPDDTVLIMWTNTSREDRYVGNRWVEGGNVYWSSGSRYPPDWVARFACERGYFIRDMAVITAVRHLLDHWKCSYRFLSMIPLQYSNELSGLGNNPQDPNSHTQDVAELYQDTLKLVRPSVYETVFNSDWRSRPGIPDGFDSRTRDFHPTPMEHLEYCDKILPDFEISAETREWAQEITESMIAGDSFEWREPNRPHRL